MNLNIVYAVPIQLHPGLPVWPPGGQIPKIWPPGKRPGLRQIGLALWPPVWPPEIGLASNLAS